MARKKNHWRAAIQRNRKRAKLGAMKAGHILEGKIVIMLSQRGTGRVYERYRPRRTHRASSPGQPPAPDRGRLRRSIKTVNKSKAGDIKVRVGSNSEYAAPLEFGGRNRAPRPFMRPALTLAKSGMTRAIKMALKGG